MDYLRVKTLQLQFKSHEPITIQYANITMTMTFLAVVVFMPVGDLNLKNLAKFIKSKN